MTKFHRVYEEPGSIFAGTQYGRQLLSIPTLESIYVALEGGNGILLIRTDLAGDLIWTHLYGDFHDSSPRLVQSTDRNHVILASYDSERAVITKIDATSGAVVWSQEYSHMDEIFTLTRRGSNYVLMGGRVDQFPSGHYLTKPVALKVADADGAVIWVKDYTEDQAPYLEEWSIQITGYAVNPGEIIYVGKYWSVEDLHAEGNRRVVMMKMNGTTGAINSMQLYDLELNANDYAIETDAPFVWGIARIQDSAGNEDGFAISGTYSHSDTYHFYETDPVVFRIDQGGAPIWSKLYGSLASSKGFGRGIYQNDYFFGDRLDVYTSWNPDLNAFSGMMRIDASDGSRYGMSVYDVPGVAASFDGLSMARDGFGGYLAVARRSAEPYNAFELLKVGNIGGGVDCLSEDALEEPIDLLNEREVVEIVYDSPDIITDDHSLLFVELELESFECDAYSGRRRG